MQRTLHEHIVYLEQKIESLKKELEEPGKSPSQQNEIEIDLGIAERALAHFRKAFDFEQRLSHTVSTFKANQ
ncbi:MAG: hypothetical protein WA294_08555 [Acidobacteriaceae bacterium]